jgi:hypothetical protein
MASMPRPYKEKIMEAARPAPVAAAPAVSTTLSYLPVGLFGAVMGLTGLALAWRLAHQAFGAPAVVGQAIGAIAVAAFVVLAVAYGVKAAAGWAAGRGAVGAGTRAGETSVFVPRRRRSKYPAHSQAARTARVRRLWKACSMARTHGASRVGSTVSRRVGAAKLSGPRTEWGSGGPCSEGALS